MKICAMARFMTGEGNKHKLESDTVCIHGDHLKLNEINKILYNSSVKLYPIYSELCF